MTVATLLRTYAPDWVLVIVLWCVNPKIFLHPESSIFIILLIPLQGVCKLIIISGVYWLSSTVHQVTSESSRSLTQRYNIVLPKTSEYLQCGSFVTTPSFFSTCAYTAKAPRSHLRRCPVGHTGAAQRARIQEQMGRT